MLDLFSLLECYSTYDHDDIHFEVVKFVLDNYHQLDTSTLQSFSDSIPISTSTANRFIRRMYYGNFAAFRNRQERFIRQYKFEGKYYPSVVDEAIDLPLYGEFLIEQIRRVTTLIDKASIDQLMHFIDSSEEIVFLSIPLQSELWRLQIELILLGKRTSAFIDPNYQIESVQQVSSKSTVISISSSTLRDNYHEVQLQTAREKGAKTIYIAHEPHLPTQAVADLSIIYDGTNTQMDSLLMQFILNYVGLLLRNKITG